MQRLTRFLIALGAGLIAGLFYGWVISPVVIVDTSPDMLSMDYRTDLVLMAAEIYATTGDLGPPVRTLKLLSPQSPDITAAQALDYAQVAGYDWNDITLLYELRSALQAPHAGEMP